KRRTEVQYTAQERAGTLRFRPFTRLSIWRMMLPHVYIAFEGGRDGECETPVLPDFGEAVPLRRRWLCHPVVSLRDPLEHAGVAARPRDGLRRPQGSRRRRRDRNPRAR